MKKFRITKPFEKLFNSVINVFVVFIVFFPFDIFLVNIFIIQLPAVLLTGTTFHGYLAGKMVTVKEIS